VYFGFSISREKSMSKIPEHVEQELQSFFELLVPNVVGLRSLLYGRQANFNKTTIQEIKVKKEIECNKKTYQEVKVGETKVNKVVFHPVKVKEEIVEIDLTSDEAIFSYIDKNYIKKFSKYIYCHWVVKSMKSLVQRKKGNHK